MSSGQTLVVVDDDQLIHAAVDLLLKKYEGVGVIHLLSAEAFEQWIDCNGLGELGTRVYWFDYDLKHEVEDGLSLIRKHGLQFESYLVTGSDAESVIKAAKVANVRMLSKSDIPKITLRSNKPHDVEELDLESWQFLYYRKPRPVFWERLFFGRDSQISSIFSEVGENGSRPLGSSLFNLDVDVESDWLGYSKEVKRSEAPVATEHFYSFGVLLAYAFIFGIRDLHKFNLVKTDTHLQVIDAEVVLTNLTLPNETILLAFKDVSFEFSAARLLVDSMESFTSDQRRLIYAGYFDLFALVSRRQKELLHSLKSVLTDAPIRIIIRNTRVYADHLNGKSEIEDLLEEEKMQLDRGDVPYFFKHLCDARVYWASSASGEKSAIRSLGSFQPDVDRHAQPVDLLLGNVDLIERKMAQGALLMQRKFSANEAFEFAWNGHFAKLKPGQVSNGSSGNQFRSKPDRQGVARTGTRTPCL